MNSGESIFCSCFCSSVLQQEMMINFRVNYQLFNTELVCTSVRDNLNAALFLDGIFFEVLCEETLQKLDKI